MADVKPKRYILKKTRALVDKRDGGKCTRCSTTEELLLHHVLPVSEGGNNSAENLLTLCWDCHKAVHIERGDWYGEKMASSKERWLEGREDFKYHRKATMCGYRPGGVEKLADLSVPERNTLHYMFGHGPEEFPSLHNISKGTQYPELQNAAILTSLIDRGYVKVIRSDSKTRYSIQRERLSDVFYRGVRYTDAAGNIIKTIGEPELFEARWGRYATVDPTPLSHAK